MSISLTDGIETIGLDKGQALFIEGESAESFYIVIEGRLACVRKIAARQVVIGVAEPSSLAGEESVLSGDREYIYSAVALDDCRLAKVDAADVNTVLNSRGDWIKDILENISEKVRNTALLVSEHQIEDDRLTGGAPLSDEDLVMIKNSLG